MRSGGKEHARRKWTMAERRSRREGDHGEQEEEGKAAVEDGGKEGRK